MHVVDMVFFWARAEPHRLALIQPEMVTTYQGLADAIDSIGDRIDRLGLDTREPLAVSIANPSFFLATVFAVLRCGFSVALVTPPLYPHLRSAGIRNLIYDAQGQVMSGGRNVRFDMSWLPAAAASGGRVPYRHRPAGSGDMICLTSEATGAPKAIVRSMAGLSRRVGSPLNCANGDHEKALVLRGLAGGFGFDRACEMLHAGKAACFSPFGEAALMLISTFAIETVVASPQQALALADIQKTARYDLPSLKTLRLEDALLSPDAARQIKTHLCRNIVVTYSSAEAGLTAAAPYDVIADVPGAVGFLSPEVDVEVVDGAGKVLPAGSEGVIRLRAPQSAANVGQPEIGGHGEWFYPGDIGRVTEEGVLCLTGRRSKSGA